VVKEHWLYFQVGLNTEREVILFPLPIEKLHLHKNMVESWALLSHKTYYVRSLELA
jgi:hypothetical protein